VSRLRAANLIIHAGDLATLPVLTERRRSPHHTIGIAHVSDHTLALERVTLD
jgi:hypothetical protein